MLWDLRVSVSFFEKEDTYLKYLLWQLDEIIEVKALQTVRCHENIIIVTKI